MNNNFLLLIPEFMVTGLAFVILTFDFFMSRDRKHWLGYLAAAGLAITLVVMLVYQWDTTEGLYDGLISIDGYSLFFRAVFLVMAIVIVSCPRWSTFARTWSTRASTTRFSSSPSLE